MRKFEVSWCSALREMTLYVKKQKNLTKTDKKCKYILAFLF